MSIRVIATDIDLTLVDDRGVLPPTNIQALQMAARAGIKLVLATARRRAPTLEVLEMLQVPATLICHNGARLWDEYDRELAHLTLDLELAQELAYLADEQRLSVVFTIDEVNYYNPATTTTSPSMRLDRTPVSALRAAVVEPPTRILVHGSRDIHFLERWLSTRSDARMYQYSRGGGEIFSGVIAHPQATKEGALEALCQQWRIPASDVMAIGDSDADAGMLRWAGIGIAPKGSMLQAIEAADWIAPSARFGGVAVAIHRYALSQLVS